MAELMRTMRLYSSGMYAVLLVILISILPAANTGPTRYHDMVISSTTANSDNEVRLYSPLNMTCEYQDLISDLSKPSITWLKKNNCPGSAGTGTIYTSSGQGTRVLGGFSVHPTDISLGADSTSGSIHMSETSVSASSCYSFTYICQVQSYEGLESDYTKHVYNASLTISLTDPAQIVSITEDMVVTEEENVKLSCKSTGIPEPNVTWSKSDKSPLPTSIGGGYLYQSDDKDGVLQLHAVTKDDSGTYKCSAENRIVSEPVIRYVSVRVEYAPDIQVNSFRVSQKRGYYTELSCQVEANPDNITASWYYFSISNINDCTATSAEDKNRISKEEDERLQVTHHANENSVTGSKLVIDPVTSTDYKTCYCCQFTNRVGGRSRCIGVLESLTPVPVNGSNLKRGQSANHSDITATLSHTLTFLTAMLTSLFMLY